MKIYVIENEEGLLWSNEDGWVDGDGYDSFTQNDRDVLDLPIDGKWVAYEAPDLADEQDQG